MDIDPAIARALGFPRPQYTDVERERRWLCGEVPRDLVQRSFNITDLYVTGSRLRLREIRPVDGGPGMLRLSRKADVDARTPDHVDLRARRRIHAARLHVARRRLRRIRHRLHSTPGVLMSVDEFQGDLTGLILFEAECKTADELNALPSPAFTTREVTSESQYTGGHLATHGLPR